MMKKTEDIEIAKNSFDRKKVEQVFFPLDLLLLGSGCQIFRQNTFAHVLNWFIILVVVSCEVLHTTFIYGPALKLDKNFLTNVMYPVFFVSGIIYMIVINNNRKTLREILETVIQNLDSQRKNKLYRSALLGSIISWALIFNFYGCYIIMSWIHKEGTPYHMHWFLRLTACIFLTHNWVVGGIHVYNFFVRAITEYEMMYFDRLLWQMQAQMYRPTPTQVCRDRMRIMVIKERFVHATGIIPVLWFLKEFIYFSGILMNLKETFLNQEYLIMSIMVYVIPLTLIISTVVSLMFVTDNCNCEITVKIDEVAREILNKEEASVWQPVLYQLDSEKKFKCRAWNLFVINKYLILSFLSSLITFSALFTQISDSMEH